MSIACETADATDHTCQRCGGWRDGGELPVCGGCAVVLLPLACQQAARAQRVALHWQAVAAELAAELREMEGAE